MTKLSLTLAAALALGLVASPAAAGTCEEDVVAECVSTTCPTFCGALPEADQASCQAACTADDRCKLTLFGGHDRADQVELDVHTREQLMSCLAENRAAIVIPEELGKPILTEDAVVTEDTTEVKRASIRDKKAKKKAWKKVKTRSYTARKNGKARINPVSTTPPETTKPKKPKKPKK